MIRAIGALADRLVERLVPSAVAAAACPQCDNLGTGYKYQCCPGCGLACYWRCIRRSDGKCDCELLGKC